MLTQQNLKDLLHLPGVSRQDQMLLLLAHELDEPKGVFQVRELAITCGLREAKDWNISNILRRSKPLAILSREGWELTSPGVEHVREIAAPLIGAQKPKVAIILRQHLSSFSDPVVKSFVEEAIACFESRLYRSAVILSWIGALSILQKHVIDNRLVDFNSEASRRNPKWRSSKNRDGLARMKESDFLDVLEAISVLGKSVKQELKGCLTFRNGCGHPNSLRIGPSRVVAHIEVLIQNVFTQYPA